MITNPYRLATFFTAALVGIFCSFFLYLATATAQPLPQINYQGKLTASTSVAVPNGTYQMEFTLYDAPTGGTTLWNEVRTGGNEVTVTDGLFSVMLGSVTPLTSVDFNQTLYLGVEIESDGEMTPRKVLGTVPAAFVAQSAVSAEDAFLLGGVASSSFLRSDAADTMEAASANTLLTINQSGVGDILNLLDNGASVFSVLDGGNVGIGTTTPQAKLSVVGEGTSSENIAHFYGTGAWPGYMVEGGTDTSGVDGLRLRNSTGEQFNVGVTGNSSSLGMNNSFFIYQQSAGAPRFVINSNGNVGIGSTTPSSKLTVAGDTYLGGNLRTTGTVRFESLTSGFLQANASGILSSVATSSFGLGDGTFAGLSDTNFSSLTSGELAQFDGFDWVNVATSSLGFVTGDTVVTVAANDTPSREKSNADYVADGTNDQVTIETALASLPSGGGKVQLLAGTYNINDAINVTQASATLSGVGNGTVLALTATSGTMYVVEMSGNGGSVSDLTIDGGAGVGGAQGGVFFDADYLQVYRLTIKNMRGNGMRGNFVNYTLIADTTILNSGVHGIDANGLLGPVLISRNTIDTTGVITSTGDGITAGNSDFRYGIISNNTIRNTGDAGISITDTYEGVQILGNRIDTAGGNGINISNGSYALVEGNWVTDAGIHGMELRVDGTINGNRVENSQQHGLLLEYGDVTVTGNNLVNNGGGVYASIYMNTGFSGNNRTVSSNVISSTGTAPLIEDVSSTNTSVLVGNIYRNNDLTEDTFVSSTQSTRFNESNRRTLTTVSEVGYNLFNITGSSSVSLASLQQTGIGSILELLDSGGNTDFIVSNAGQVGIGTSTDLVRLLTVAGATNAGGRFIDTTNQVTLDVRAEDFQGFIGTVSNSDLRFVTNNTSRMTLDAAGQLGIGTTTMSSQFEVWGDGSGTLASFYGNNEDIRFYSNGSVNDRGADFEFYRSNAGAVVQDGYKIGGNRYYSYDGSDYSRSAEIIINADGGQGNADVPAEMLFNVAADGETVDEGDPELVIRSNGNVGIGDASPSSRLTVNALNVAGTRERIIDAGIMGVAGGFVIGNSTNSDGQFDPLFTGMSSRSGGSALNFRAQVSSANDTGTSDLLVFQTVSNDGDLLNGTFGSVVNRPLVAFKNHNDTLLQILANGNVGIGTTTPGSKLTVDGTGLFTQGVNVSLDQTYQIGGSSVLRRYNGPFFGYTNLYVGGSASNLDTANAFGNVSVGNALTGITTGYVNTAVGYRALSAITSSYSNTAMGKDSLRDLTSGNSNTAVGESSAILLKSGSDGVFIGAGVGRNLSTSSDSVIIGTDSVGSLSGGQTISRLTTLGYRAGYALQTGANNNLLLGYRAADSLTTGANNIIIGYDVEAPSNTGSNQLNIGNLLFGTGIDGTGTTLSGGNIGIGTTTPGQKLTIVGNAYSTGDLYVGNTTAESARIQIREISDRPAFAIEAPNIDSKPAFTIRIPNSGEQKAFQITAGSEFTARVSFETVSTATGLLLGSGVASRDTKLVRGSSGQLILGTGSADRLTILSSGNVGIGTSTPNAKLDVWGGDALINGLTVGRGNGQETTSTAFGTNALGATDGSAVFNTAIGYSALPVNVSADFITAIGQGTLESYVSGGGQMTAIGAGAMNALISGALNTAVGTFSMVNATNSDSNAVLGFRGMQNGGSDNTAVGAFVMQNAGSGASGNVALGKMSLQQVLGGNNIALGYQAGNSLTTGTNNIIIGYDVEAPSNTGSNQLNIGNLLFGTGIDGTGTTLSSGNIGIGTTTSIAKLNIGGNTSIFDNYISQTGSNSGLTFDFNDRPTFVGTNGASYLMTIRNNASNDGSTSKISFGNNDVEGAAIASIIDGTKANTYLTFGTRGSNITSEKMRIMGNGNIGIGTTSPSAKLDVWGNVFISTTSDAAFAIKDAAGNVALIVDTNESNIDRSTAFINHEEIGIFGSGRGVSLGIENSGPLESFINYSSNRDFQFRENGFVTMMISGDTSNVGIGTTSPSSRLTVSGDFFLTGALRDSSNSAGINGYILQTTGSGTQWVATSTLGFSGGGATFSNSAELAALLSDETGSAGGGLSVFSNAPTFSTRITTPVVVGGAAATSQLILQSTTGVGTTDSILFRGGNNGATQLGKLDAGLTNNVAFGSNAGATFNSLSTNNVAIGFEAGRYASTTSSDNNNFLGYFAGYNNTGSTNNIFGSSAGLFNTGNRNNILGDEAGNGNAGNLNNIFGADAGTNNTGSHNNVLGWFAGSSNTGGYNNLIGAFAGDFNTGTNNNLIGEGAGGSNEGNQNNILGYYAGYSNTGSNNNIFGSSAGDGNTGIYNNIFGEAAGFGNTGSNTNMFGLNAGYANAGSFVNLIGSGAGYTNTGSYTEFIGTEAGRRMSASNSVVLGSFALRGGAGSGANNATTTNNTVIGYGAGYNVLTGGNNNLLLGYQAADNLTTGANNIVLGYDVDVQSATQSNTLNIGNLIFGTGLDGTGTTLATGNIGIGTTTPGSKLSIQNNTLSGAGVSGLSQYLTTTNSVASAVQFGNYFELAASNTATTTLVGSLFRVADSTTFGNTVRGLEVQTNRGTNTQGENTALSGFARTFGVRGVTSADAGASFEPAGGFFETEGTTQGNALRAYSGSITTATLLSLFQDTSAFSGTGLEMNFGNTTGDFASTSSKYLDFQNGGSSVFTVSAYGTTTIGDGTTANLAGLQIGYGGICVDNDGTCNASIAGRIASVSTFTGNSDLAETYFSSQTLNPGEVVTLAGELSVVRSTKNNPQPILGVVSTKPGLLLGADDVSTRSGEASYPIALSGRVPVRLSTENGPIKQGDQLMLSSLAGTAMKATGTGATIGIALEDFNDSRMYSDTYLNQFGDDMVDPVYEPVTSNTDPRINDGCYFGGGTQAGEAPCVPLKATTTAGQINEVNQQLAAESVAEQVEALKYISSQSRTLEDGKQVQVGQVVMFVESGYRWLTPEMEIAVADVMNADISGLNTLLERTAEDEETTFGVTATIIEAVTVLWNKVTGIEERLERLEAENEALKARVEQIEAQSSDGTSPAVPREEPQPQPTLEPEPEPVQEPQPTPEPEGESEPESAPEVVVEPVVAEPPATTAPQIEEEEVAAEPEVEEEVIAEEPQPTPEPEPEVVEEEVVEESLVE